MIIQPVEPENMQTGIEIHLRSHVLVVLNVVLLQMCAWYLRFWVITY